MQNFNPLSDQAIQFRENAYLITEAIPQFQFDGISAFTFGTTILIKESNSSSIIYNQNDGFEIGFHDLCLYLKSPFGNFQINNNDINFNLNTWYTISISYDLSVINLYVNGIKAIWFSKETKNQVIPNTQYNIGNNFTGFIKNLYVYNICLSDSEILANFNNSLCKTDSLVAWFASSGVNFIDKSKNNIPVSRSSNLAKFCNICSGLDLSQKGYIKSDCSCIDYTYYSLLTKLYLNNNYESNSYTIITNTDKTDKSGFRIYVENIKTDTFNLLCEIFIPESEPLVLKSATTITGQNWVDIGLTSGDGKAELFVNGCSVASIARIDNLCLKGNNILTIGAGLNNSIPYDYMDGFVAYFSEFSKVLTSDDFARYMENPPFVLSNSIQSLYYFVDPTPIEKMHDTAFTYEQGACFSVFADTQQISTPTTVLIEIDNEGCKDWDEYTDSEKWSIKEYAGILEAYIVNSGLSPAVQEEWFKTPVIAKYIDNSIKQNPAFNNYINIGPDVTTNDTYKLLAASTILISTIAIIFYGILKADSKFALAAILKATLSATVLELITESLCALAILGAVTLLTTIIIKSLSDRPTPDDPDNTDLIVITFLSSNFIVSDDITESAIDITKDGTKSIREESFQDAVCYVVSKLKTPYIKVNVKCTFSTNPQVNIILKGTELSDPLLGNVISEPFTIALNETKEIKFYLNDNRLTKDKKKVCNTMSNWYWEVECEGKNIFIQNTKQTVYTVFDTPKIPWKLSNQGVNLPWTDVLEIAATWINKNSESDLSIDSISERLTNGVYECGFKLNLDTGIPEYVQNPTSENGNLKLDIYSFNQDFKSKKMPEFGVSSLDCSLLLATLARLHGANMNQATLTGGKFNQGFHINDVQPIGYDKWMQPYANATDPIGFLGYHCVAVKEDSLNSWYNLSVYDACFKLNDGAGNAVLPVKKVMGLISSEQNVSSVDKLTYRGQLVRTGEINYVLMPVTTTWEVVSKKQDNLDLTIKSNKL